MAENSVFSNETGQVMFGSGGQIYKVPYSNGYYRNANGGNYYIKIEGFELEDEYSYMWSILDNLTDSSAIVGMCSLFQSSTNRAENTMTNGAASQCNTMEDGGRETLSHPKK